MSVQLFDDDDVYLI